MNLRRRGLLQCPIYYILNLLKGEKCAESCHPNTTCITINGNVGGIN